MKINPGIFRHLLRYVTEASIVAFGVVLGLYLSERNAQIKTDTHTRETLRYIIEEIRVNQKELEQAKIYHDQLSIEFDSVARSLSEADIEEIYYKSTKFRHFNLPSWKGLGLVKVKNVVYESAKLGGILQELNIRTIQQIASVYDNLEEYERVSQTTSARLLGITADTRVADVLGILELIKYDIRNYEISLSSRLNSVADELRDSIESGNYRK